MLGMGLGEGKVKTVFRLGERGPHVLGLGWGREVQKIGRASCRERV